jgi:hypothetical protein
MRERARDADGQCGRNIHAAAPNAGKTKVARQRPKIANLLKRKNEA